MRSESSSHDDCFRTDAAGCMNVMKPQGIATPAPAVPNQSRHFGDRVAALAAAGRIGVTGLALPLQRARDYEGRGVSGGLGDVLLERDRELVLIGGGLGRGRGGGEGGRVVEGPAGIGKTVLLAAARDAARTQGFRVLRARGAELE